MQTLSAFVAIASLLLAIASIAALTGAVLALFLFPLFMLRLAGVMAGLEERTVRHHNTSINPTGWRDGR
jgi:hypothetical protein